MAKQIEQSAPTGDRQAVADAADDQARADHDAPLHARRSSRTGSASARRGAHRAPRSWRAHASSRCAGSSTSTRRTWSTILNELEERGYATRRRDPEDRRRHLVEVSKKGLAVIDKVSEVMDGVEDELLDGLDPAERKELEGILTSIWEQSGGYEAWSQVADEPEEEAA